jgi:hypothetical protein
MLRKRIPNTAHCRTVIPKIRFARALLMAASFGNSTLIRRETAKVFCPGGFPPTERPKKKN